ncbi:hypothetical protein E2C01_099514 [Portunus trituberculatus]|uniref:Uncharacterized protein n=1 Tax=Portunus trituberculatus TaxID=210409 RepID=A0A5B7KFK9_PORTR|nr:hypothetical protein [Portunus trituberculatus]
MANYDPSVRPARNSSQALSVVFGVSLHSIIDVVGAHGGHKRGAKGKVEMDTKEGKQYRIIDEVCRLKELCK